MDSIDTKPIAINISRNILCLICKFPTDGLSTSKNTTYINVPVANPCRTTENRTTVFVSSRLLTRVPTPIPIGDVTAKSNIEQCASNGFVLSESICNPT